MTARTLERGVELFVDSQTLALEFGGELPGYVVTHRSIGAEGAPVVIVQGGISATCHVADSDDTHERGWWREIVGPGLAIDTDRFCVISLDVIGGPRAPFGDDVTVSPIDQARVTLRLIDRLGIGRVHAFVGASYGGLVGMALASIAPNRLDQLVTLCCAHRPHPWATAWRSLQRSLLRLGRESGRADTALAIARAMGMLSYRTPIEFEQRFAEPTSFDNGVPTFDVEAYLNARGRAFCDRFTNDALERLSLAIDLGRIDPASILVPTTVIASRSDQLVPLSVVEEFYGSLAIPRQFVAIDSRYGHDAFLKESTTLTPLLRSSLAGAVESLTDGGRR